MPAPLRAPPQGRQRPLGWDDPQLAGLRVAEPDQRLADLRRQRGDHRQLGGDDSQRQDGRQPRPRRLQRRQPHRDQRGRGQQGRPGQRAAADRGRAELAEAAAAQLRPGGPQLDQGAGGDQEQQRGAEPDRRSWARRGRCARRSGSARRRDRTRTRTWPSRPARAGAPGTARWGRARPRPSGPAARARASRCSRPAAARPAAVSAPRGPPPGARSAADRDRRVEAAALQLAAERDEAGLGEVGNPVARRGAAGDAPVVEQPRDAAQLVTGSAQELPVQSLRTSKTLPMDR